MMKKIITLGLLLSVVALLNASSLKEQAETKIVELESLIIQAEGKALDAEREKLAVWVAKEFIRFADWDASADGLADNEREFAKFAPYADQKKEMAEALPDQERQDVITILDVAIKELSEVIEGTRVRPAVRLVDWENVSIGQDEFVSEGKPIFLYDYFSKSMGAATDNDTVYNDYLGNIDHPKSINNQYLNQDMSFVSWRTDQLKNHPSTRIGYSMLWHKGNASWQNATNIPEVDKGVSMFVTYDIDNPTMREVWEKTLKESASLLKGNKAIDLGYCLVNEPHWFSSGTGWPYNKGEMTDISSYTLDKFKEWLKVKYNDDINALDQSWQAYYWSFDQVEWTMPVPASLQGTPKWYDWCRFNMDRVNEWFSFLQSSIHASDPDANTHIKMIPNHFTEAKRHHGIDYEFATELTSFMGDDAKTHKRYNASTTPDEWEEHYAYYWEELALAYDFMESVAPDKLHVNSESHFLSSVHWRDLRMQPAYVRNVYWLATVLGMDANLAWFWARDPDGTMEDRLFPDGNYTENSYAGSAAQQPLVVNEYAKVMMDLNSCSEDIMALRRQERPVRIFYSETSAINDLELMPQLKSLYESMFFDGVPMGFATKNIIEKQDHNWEAIMVYAAKYVTDDEFEALQSYLDDGGTVVIDNGRSLSMNEHGQARSQVLVQSKGTLMNLGTSATLAQMKTKAQEILASTQKQTAILLSQENGLTQKGCVWRTAANEEGYVLTIMNVGKTSADINLSLRNGHAIGAVKDILSGQDFGTSFSIPSEGTLMLQVYAQSTDLDEALANANIQIVSKKKQLIIRGLSKQGLSVYNILGQKVYASQLQNETLNVDLDSGVYLVHIEGEGTAKVLVD